MTNFYHELRIDSSSFLLEYYKKNKYLLTDEEDEEEGENEENKNLEIPSKKERLSKQGTLTEENKVSLMNGAIKLKEPSSKAKKPILPANITDALKTYYESVEKTVQTLLKLYELNETNGK